MGEGTAVARPGRANVVRALLIVCGGVLLAAAVLYNRYTLAPLASGAFEPLTLEKIRRVQWGFGAAGLLSWGAAWALAKRPAWVGSRVAEWLLLLLVGLLPFALLDFGLRPFVEPRTTIFQEDRELGWRMRPGAVDEWGGARIRVNENGLRGPVVAVDKPAGSRRIVFVGDSVTFGYGVADEGELFVSRVGRALAADGAPVEVVNAGVGGYAPWQERLWLEREGLAYAPDLVVVGFVLNDVTEPLSLVRYGGQGRGWQLARSAQGALDRWGSGSALVTVLRRGRAALRFGRDVQLGAAQQEARDVMRLALDPSDPVVARGWSIALGDLDGLLDAAEQGGARTLVVVFPYALQLEAPVRLGAPQRLLVRHLRQRGTPVLDLLPRFADHPQPETLLLDPSHLSVRGHALAAEAIVQAIRAASLLPAAGPAPGAPGA